MFIGWLTCTQRVLRPHSLCRFTTANAPANRQMPIASVVSGKCKKKYEKQHFIDNLHFRYILISFYQQRKEKKKYTRFACIVYLINFRIYKYENCNSWLGFTNMGLS